MVSNSAVKHVKTCVHNFFAFHNHVVIYSDIQFGCSVCKFGWIFCTSCLLTMYVNIFFNVNIKILKTSCC